MPLKKTAVKSSARARRSAKPRTTARSSKLKVAARDKSIGTTAGHAVKKISRRYLSPLGRSEVGVKVIKKAVRQAAKESLTAEARSLKKAAKRL